MNKHFCMKPIMEYLLLGNIEFNMIEITVGFFCRRSKKSLLKRLYVTSENASPL